MTGRRLKLGLMMCVGAGVLLSGASIALSWRTDDSFLSSALFWVGFVMLLVPALMGARASRNRGHPAASTDPSARNGR